MIFYLAVTATIFGWKVLDYVPIIHKEGYVVLDVPFQNIVKDISNLCLGSTGNLTLVKDIAEAVGIELKNLGVDAVVFGTFDTLSKDDKDPLKRFSVSPYITVQVIEFMVDGFYSAGVFPIVDARGKVDEEVVRVFISRGLFFPVYVENKDKMDYLKSLGYNTMFFTREGPLVGREITLNWTSEKSYDIEHLRKEILKKSIVILNPKGEGVAINEPFSTKKVLIFSPEEWLYELAKKVEKGEMPSTGRPVW